MGPSLFEGICFGFKYKPKRKKKHILGEVPPKGRHSRLPSTRPGIFQVGRAGAGEALQRGVARQPHAQLLQHLATALWLVWPFNCLAQYMGASLCRGTPPEQIYGGSPCGVPLKPQKRGIPNRPPTERHMHLTSRT